MNRHSPARSRRRLRAAVAAVVPLALGLCLPSTATAGVTALYDCPRVTYHSIFPNTPLNGSGCTGPAGTYPGGTVLDLSTGTVYGCGSVTGSTLPDGSIWVFGNVCSP